jgi:hypothetical protein
MSNDSTRADTPTVTDSVTVTLDTPIRRGDTTIATVTLRRPRVGELRGLLLSELLQMQVDALATLLPRITQPTLTRPEIDALDPADLIALSTPAIGFFLNREQRQAAGGNNSPTA